jgi:insertion element IS1 protein InsB
MSRTTLDRPACPQCGVGPVVRNGVNSAGTQTFRCNGCHRRFVETPQRGPVSAETKALIERLLGERLGLRAITRVTGVSRSWLQAFVNDLYQRATPWEPGPLKKSPAT